MLPYTRANWESLGRIDVVSMGRQFVVSDNGCEVALASPCQHQACGLLQGGANAVSQPLSENTSVCDFRALVRHGDIRQRECVRTLRLGESDRYADFTCYALIGVYTRTPPCPREGIESRRYFIESIDC